MSYRGGGFRTIRYQESFNRADQPPFLGTNWNMEQTPASNVAGVTVDGNVNVASLAAFGATGGVMQMVWTPQYVNRQLIKNLSQTRVQYAQITMKSIAGVNCSIGPTVLKAEPNSGGCYVLVAQAAGQALQLFRNVDASAVILNAAVGVWAVNDVIRIEATVAAASTTIRCFKNGVLQSTDVDSTGARIGFGMYGVCYFSSVGASQLGFSDFDGGLN